MDDPELLSFWFFLVMDLGRDDDKVGLEFGGFDEREEKLSSIIW